MGGGKTWWRKKDDGGGRCRRSIRQQWRPPLTPCASSSPARRTSPSWLQQWQWWRWRSFILARAAAPRRVRKRRRERANGHPPSLTPRHAPPPTTPPAPRRAAATKKSSPPKRATPKVEAPPPAEEEEEEEEDDDDEEVVEEIEVVLPKKAKGRGSSKPAAPAKKSALRWLKRLGRDLVAALAPSCRTHSRLDVSHRATLSHISPPATCATPNSRPRSLQPRPALQPRLALLSGAVAPAPPVGPRLPSASSAICFLRVDALAPHRQHSAQRKKGKYFFIEATLSCSRQTFGAQSRPAAAAARPARAGTRGPAARHLPAPRSRPGACTPACPAPLPPGAHSQ